MNLCVRPGALQMRLISGISYGSGIGLCDSRGPFGSLRGALLLGTARPQERSISTLRLLGFSAVLCTAEVAHAWPSVNC